MSQPNCNVSFLPFDESGTFTGQLGRFSGGQKLRHFKKIRIANLWEHVEWGL